MLNSKYFCKIAAALLSTVAAAMTMTSCLKSDGETIPLEFDGDNGTTTEVTIPADEYATENPTVDANTLVPNFGNSVAEDDSSDSLIVELYLPGIKYPDDDTWLYLVGTDGAATSTQNVWVSVDSSPKGCIALNNSSNEVSDQLDVDFVFLVDNSSNMNAVGDILADELLEWSDELSSVNISLQCGCVGYGGSESDIGVDGAMDLCTAQEMVDYLNTDSVTGTARTKGYGGDYATYLSKISTISFSNCAGECGVEALRYADAVFTFRQNSCRIFMNFTDEANQPGGDEQWSVEYVNDQDNWPAYKGTVHTVFSGNASFSEQDLAYEWPWKLSEYTGGITYYSDSNYTGVSLDELEATNSVKNYYVIMFKLPASYSDGESHTVQITVLSTDSQVQANKEFYMEF